MKKWKFASALAATLAAAALSVWAADLVKYSAQPRGNTVKIDGTSTIHDWEMVGHLIGGALQLDPAVKLDPAAADVAGATDGKIQAQVRAIIPVRSLHSEHTTMDEIMQEAMNEPAHPRIVYKLKELKLAKTAHQPHTPFQFDSTGDLTVNGVTKQIAFPVTITPEGNLLRISGSAKLKMTDFNVTPPRPKLALGLLHTGDEITVSFDWTVAKPS